MSAYFVDSSALAKRYVEELGSKALRAMLDGATGCRIVIARITCVELASALTRRLRVGEIAAGDAADARADLAADMDREFRIVELTEPIAMDAMALAERHALRAYDAVQLATALHVNQVARGAGLESVPMVSNDVELNVAAEREGLAVIDPNVLRD